MPCAWAMPHMIAGVTAAPRWQWSSASGTVRGRVRGIGPRGYLPAAPDVLGAGEPRELGDEPAVPAELGEVGPKETHLPALVADDRRIIAVELADRHPEGAVEIDLPREAAVTDLVRKRARPLHPGGGRLRDAEPAKPLFPEPRRIRRAGHGCGDRLGAVRVLHRDEARSGSERPSAGSAVRAAVQLHLDRERDAARGRQLRANLLGDERTLGLLDAEATEHEGGRWLRRNRRLDARRRGARGLRR